MDSEYDAVLFDMDGVTVQSASEWRELERTEILPAAVADGVPLDRIRALSVSDAYDELAAADDVTLSVSAAEFDALYDEHAPAVYGERADLLDGCRELLAALRADGVATGLVSASRRSWVELVLDRFDLHDLYDAVVSASDVDGPSKPDPAPYRLAADEIGVGPDRCLVVEDSPAGIGAATAAGMDCIALRTPSHTDADLADADRIVTSLAEVPVLAPHLATE